MAAASDDALDPLTGGEIEYRSVEPWAIGSLLIGMASPLALLAPLLWLVPPLGMLASSVALARLRRDASRIGRTPALVGLGLSILFGVAPFARMASDYVLLRDQARPLADQFVEYVRQDRPEKAVSLRVAPDARPTLDDLDDEGLWKFYRQNAEAKRDLTAFVSVPIVRTMLALGPRADVRFYRTAGIGTDGSYAQVVYWYTVTFVDEQEKKKTFLVGVVLDRKPTQMPGLSPWRVKDFFGPIDPRKLG